MFHVKHAEFTKPKLFAKIVKTKARRRACNAKKKGEAQKPYVSRETIVEVREGRTQPPKDKTKPRRP